MKFVYACYGKAGLDCLYQLLNQSECSPSNIFVITYADDTNRALIDHLNALGMNYTTEPLRDGQVLDRIIQFAPDYLFSIYYREIFPVNLIESVAHAAVNLHPSLLPDYKGCFSAPWVLINGEQQTGTTYHVIDKGIDTGNILVQKSLEIMPWDTAFSLYHRLAALGCELFPTMFQRVVREGYRGKQQPTSGRLYKREIPYGGWVSLDWGRTMIHNFIRAMYFPPYAGARLSLDGSIFEFKTIAEFDGFSKVRGLTIP